jgi:hypothetical protein
VEKEGNRHVEYVACRCMSGRKVEMIVLSSEPIPPSGHMEEVRLGARTSVRQQLKEAVNGIPIISLESHMEEEDWRALEALSGLPREARILIMQALDVCVIRTETKRGVAPTALRSRSRVLGRKQNS